MAAADAPGSAVNDHIDFGHFDSGLSQELDRIVTALEAAEWRP